MQNTRPKNLNFFTIQFPIPSIVSFLHRVTGIALFVLIPVFLLTLSYSLTDYGFEQLLTWFKIPWVKFLLWLCLIPYCFHLTAGIRHLLMDIQLGVSLFGGRFSAWAACIISLLLVIIIGMLLW